MSQLKGKFMGLKAVCDSCGYKEDMEDLTEADIGLKCPECGEVMIDKGDVEALAEIKQHVMELVESLGGEPSYPMGCKDDEDGNLVVPPHVSALLLDHKTGDTTLAIRNQNDNRADDRLDVLKDVQCMWATDPTFAEKIAYMHDKMHKEQEGEEDRLH